MQKSVRKIAIIGGGPAGLAAAVTLATSGFLKQPDTSVELFEATSRLGGRTTSFTDLVSGVMLDTCQHVLMGCCTATIDFFKTAGLLDRFDVHDRYHFFDASSRCYNFAATRGLPAPLHLLSGFWRLKYLTRVDRLRIVRSLMRLQKMSPADCVGRTIGDWLREEGHSSGACERFWAVVLTGALSETLDRASLAAARKVFVDGFLASRDAYRLWVPREPLGTIFDQAVGTWLEKQGVVIHRKTPVRRLVVEEKGQKGDWLLLPSQEMNCQFQSRQKVPVPFLPHGCLSPFPIETSDGQTHPFDQVIVAVPSHRFDRLVGKGVRNLLCEAPSGPFRQKVSDTFSYETTGAKKRETEKKTAGKKGTGTICTDDPQPVSTESKWSQSPFSPITAIHLWFDRPISDLPHAVLVDQRGNWMFRPPYAEPNYAQLVISESRSLLGLSREAREETVQQLAAELVQTVSGGRHPEPKLLRHHTITHPRAVFSITPDSDRCRPESRTAIENLSLAGDWTATGWPATIEGAIRSGIAAVNQVLT